MGQFRNDKNLLMQPAVVERAFQDWCEQFSASPLGAKALAMLDEAFPDNRGGKRISFFGTSLRSVVLRGCFCAVRYKPADDPSNRRRSEQAAAVAESELRHAYLKRLSRYVRSSAALPAVVKAYADVRDKGVLISPAKHAQGLYIPEYFAIILRALYDNLRERPRAADAYCIGCLRFEHPPRGPRFRPKTMLLFDLTQAFRLASQGRVRQAGDLMPRHEDADYAVAAAFVRACFAQAAKKSPKELTQSFRRTFEKESSTATFCDWPLVRMINDRMRIGEE